MAPANIIKLMRHNYVILRQRYVKRQILVRYYVDRVLKIDGPTTRRVRVIGLRSGGPQKPPGPAVTKKARSE